MSTICRDCEAIVVADDDVPADLVRIGAGIFLGAWT